MKNRFGNKLITKSQKITIIVWSAVRLFLSTFSLWEVLVVNYHEKCYVNVLLHYNDYINEVSLDTKTPACLSSGVIDILFEQLGLAQPDIGYSLLVPQSAAQLEIYICKWSCLC